MSEPLVALYIFVLSCFIGYWVIWGVTPSLHTPLVALTNAISGIVIVGALLGHDLMRRVYDTAIRERYRFYSYGDGMLVL